MNSVDRSADFDNTNNKIYDAYAWSYLQNV